MLEGDRFKKGMFQMSLARQYQNKMRDGSELWKTRLIYWSSTAQENTVVPRLRKNLGYYQIHKPWTRKTTFWWNEVFVTFLLFLCITWAGSGFWVLSFRFPSSSYSSAIEVAIGSSSCGWEECTSLSGRGCSLCLSSHLLMAFFIWSLYCLNFFVDKSYSEMCINIGFSF